jgi:hypothetical protein
MAPWWWFLRELKHVGATIGVLIVLIFLWFYNCVHHCGKINSALKRNLCLKISYFKAPEHQSCTRHKIARSMKYMKNMLSTWKEDQHQCHIPVSMLLVQAKACTMCEDLSKCDDNVTPISASISWFSRFTKRYNFHNMNMTGKAASTDTVVVIHYTRWGCQSPKCLGTHSFKWKYCAQFARHFSRT